MQPFASLNEDPSRREACRIQSSGRPAEFSAATMAEFEEAARRYPNKQAAILPALWMAQRDFGWISQEVIDMVARLCEAPPSHVYAVVSFYTMYHRVPKGKHVLQLCTNLSCQMKGAEHMLECLKAKLGIGLGETTPDGMFTLEEVECLAACEMAPVIQIDDAYIGPLTAESTNELIDRLARGEKP